MHIFLFGGFIMKKFLKKFISVVLAILLFVAPIPLNGLGFQDLSIHAEAAEIDEPQTLEEKVSLVQQYYIDVHKAFIEDSNYKNVMSNERWAHILNEGASSTAKDVAECVYDILHVADSIITLNFDDLSFQTDSYTTVVTALFTDTNTSKAFDDIYNRYVDNKSVDFFNKLKKAFQSSSAWSNEYDFDLEMEKLWNLKVVDYDNNAFCKFIHDFCVSSGATELQVYGLFADVAAYSEILSCAGDVKTLVDTLLKWGKYEANIEAFRETSVEFKEIFGLLKGSGNEQLDKAIETYISCLDDEYANELLKKKIIVDGVLTSINILDEVFKPLLAKGAVKAFGLTQAATSKLAAVLFAADFGFKLGNALTGTDKIIECKKLLRANSLLENRLYSILMACESSFMKHKTYYSAKLFDTAYNMFRGVQVFSLESYSNMLSHVKDTLGTRILSWAKLRDVSEYENEIKFCASGIAIWNETICHDPNVLITSDYLEVYKNHIYTIACPTDVLIKNSDNETLVEIVDDKIKQLDESCVAIVINSIKAIVVPSDIKCEILITGTDVGSMNYTVDEYYNNNMIRTIKYTDVPLEDGSLYTAQIPDDIAKPGKEYTFKNTNQEDIAPDYDSMPEGNEFLASNVVSFISKSIYYGSCSVNVREYVIDKQKASQLMDAVVRNYQKEYGSDISGAFTYYVAYNRYDNSIVRLNFNYDEAGSDLKPTSYVDAETDAVNYIMNETNNMNDFEKAIFVHDWLVLNGEYDLELPDLMEEGLTDEQYEQRYKKFALLVNGKGVCGTYGEAYEYIMNKIGVKCIYLSSKDMNHAWNLIQLNGEWYHVDCTWDDPVKDRIGLSRYEYFLINDDEIEEKEHFSWVPDTNTSVSTVYSNIPRGDTNKVAYGENKWCYLSGSKLYISNLYGEEKTLISNKSYNAFDIYENYVYAVKDRIVYRLNINNPEEEKIVYCLEEPAKSAYISDSGEFSYYTIYGKSLETFNVNEYNGIDSISFSDSYIKIDNGERKQITAIAYNGDEIIDLNTKQFNWSSSDEAIVSVDENGYLSPDLPGKAIVTASIGDIKAECEVEVSYFEHSILGVCGDQAIWNLNPEHCTLTISGEGDMYDFKSTSTPWYKYCKYIKTIIIDDSITGIGEYAFSNCKEITEAVIPNSVLKIGSAAFRGCSSLAKIKILNEKCDINMSSSTISSTATIYGLENSTAQEYATKYSRKFIVFDPSHIHSFTGVVIPATCTVQGYTLYTCECGESYKDDFTSDGPHSFGEWIVKEPATCTQKGIEMRVCACGISEEREIPESAHSYGRWIIKEPATCTEKGIKYATCVCGDLIISEIPAKGHRPSAWITDTVESYNCEGTKHIECTDCGEILEKGTIPRPLPSPVVKFTLENCNNGVKISWKEARGADEYIIYRKKYVNGKWELSWSEIGSSKTLNYFDTDVKSGEHYKYTIKASNTTGIGGFNETGFIIKYLTKPKISNVSNSSGGVTVKWGKISGASGYKVYRKTSNGWKYLGKTSKTYFTDTTAKSGKKYTYTVKAYSGEYNSSYNSSGVSRYYLDNPSLNTPSSTTKGIGLRWSKVTGAEGYIVYRKTGTGSYSRIATVKGSTKVTYTDKSAKKGKKYTYKVKAYYSKTYSAYSNTKTITDKY